MEETRTVQEGRRQCCGICLGSNSVLREADLTHCCCNRLPYCLSLLLRAAQRNTFYGGEKVQFDDCDRNLVRKNTFDADDLRVAVTDSCFRRNSQFEPIC